MLRIVDIRLVSAFWSTLEAKTALNCKSPLPQPNFFISFYRNDVKRFLSPGLAHDNDDIISEDYGSEDARQI